MTTTEHFIRDGNDLVDARASWLADPGSVHVAPSPGGGWDVVLRIDGTYSNRDDAQDVADLFQSEIHRIAAEARAAATRAYRQAAARMEVAP